jgi:hypothetical protein
MRRSLEVHHIRSHGMPCHCHSAPTSIARSLDKARPSVSDGANGTNRVRGSGYGHSRSASRHLEQQLWPLGFIQNASEKRQNV